MVNQSTWLVCLIATSLAPAAALGLGAARQLRVWPLDAADGPSSGSPKQLEPRRLAASGTGNEAASVSQMLKALESYSRTTGKHVDSAGVNLTELQKLTLRSMLEIGGDCNLCQTDHEWLFILGTRQSGSTELLERVNAIPGYHLSGENFGVMKTLFDMYEVAQWIPVHENEDNPAWKAGDISEQEVLCALQTYVKAIIGEFDEPNTIVIGFKEIRHHVEPQLDFFQTIFPCARFVINTVQSAGASDESLRRQTDRLVAWQGEHPDEAFLLRKEQINAAGLNALLSWLDVDGCQYVDGLPDHAQRRLYGLEEAALQLQGACHSNRWNDWESASFSTTPETWDAGPSSE